MRAIIILGLILLASCEPRWLNGPNAYQDDFGSYQSIDDLIDGNNEQWSFFQISHPDNYLSVDSTTYRSDGRSLRATAVASTEELGASKASINKQFMSFWEGETIVVSMWLMLEADHPANWLFLFDLEERTNIGAGPGMRLALVDSALRVEHKYPNPDLIQPVADSLHFPRNHWVNIRFEARLSQAEDGYVKVWQDDLLILEQYEWQTLPKDLLYAIQGTRAMYNQVEFGVTANSDDGPTTVWVDAVDIFLKS